MSSEYGTWHDYQEAVAAAFRELGCRAEVDKTVTGARGRHEIDVYVTFEKLGQECHWIVEAKLWARPVGKSVVQTLQTVVQNVGADRGFIFSESGFQSGAFTASQNANILLDSLEDRRRTAHLPMSLARLRRQLAVRIGDKAVPPLTTVSLPRPRITMPKRARG